MRLKKFCLIAIALAVLVGCDQGKKMVTPVMDDIQEPGVKDKAVPYPELIFDPQNPDPPLIPQHWHPTDVIPEITFENVLDLAPGGKYRLRPIDADEGSGDKGFIYGIGWGSIGEDRRLREGFTAADPKIRAWFSTSNPSTVGKLPYAKTLDGKPVIVKDPVWDEIVIQIVENPWGKSLQETGGPRGNRFEFTRVEYAAILIENLTHPDRTVEYE